MERPYYTNSDPLIMNLHDLFHEFNPSYFVVYTCLLIFSVLFALRLDGTITISYWLVFLPIWIWKCLVIIGALVGTYVWTRNPEYRLSDSSYIHFKSMLISLSLQLLLLMFELLVCDKLESGRHIWILAFIPLIFISLLSIAICIWAFKNDRAFDLEVFCAVNILQFIFIALRLDRFITWSWVIVFVPLWIIMCLAVIGVLYAFIFAAILLRTPEVAIEQRKASIHSAIFYSLIWIPVLIFLILLSNKLDSTSEMNFSHMRMSSNSLLTGNIRTSYFTVSIPLHFVFLILICFSFNSKGNNQWWFGMRKDFCSFLLSICPCLREYGNISYTKQSSALSSRNASQNIAENGNPSSTPHNCKVPASHAKKPIVPHMTLDCPD